MAANGTFPQHQVNPIEPDTLRRTIDTHCVQLKLADSLQLWREWFNTLEHFHSLMTRKRKPKPSLQGFYYDHVPKICWKSQVYLFHAFAAVRNYTLNKLWNRKMSSKTAKITDL